MKNIYSLLPIAIGITFCFCSVVHAQNTFEKVIDTLGSNGAGCVLETFDGGYILAGGNYYNNNDASIIKLDSTGSIEWVKMYSGAGADGAIYIVQLPDSGYIVNGRYDVGLNTKNWLLRLDANGDTLWTKILSAGTGSTFACQLAVSNNGNYGLTGYFQNQLLPIDAYLIITDSEGVAQASKIYSTTVGSEGYAITNCNPNSYVLAGEIGVTSSTSDFYLIKTDSVGDTLWTKSYDNSQNDVAFAIEQTKDSGFVFTGVTWNSATFNYNIYLIKTDSIGDTLWAKYYYSPIPTEAYSLDQTTDGGYIIVGTIVDGIPLNRDVYLIKTDSYGDTLWAKQFGGTGPDNGYFVRQTKDGGYLICGTTSLSNGGIYLIKTDSMGNVVTGLGGAEINNPLDFTIFPNPCSGVFNIRLNGLPQGKSNLEIYNLNNDCIYACEVKNRIAELIDLNKMPSGLYLIMLRTNDKIISKKIILQK